MITLIGINHMSELQQQKTEAHKAKLEYLRRLEDATDKLHQLTHPGHIINEEIPFFLRRQAS